MEAMDTAIWDGNQTRAPQHGLRRHSVSGDTNSSVNLMNMY